MKRKYNEDIDLSEVNANFVTELYKSLQENITKGTSELDNLTEIMSNFKAIYDSYFSLFVEKNKIIKKYSKSTQTGNNYNLPGVFASTLGTYDLDAMKSDNDKLVGIIDNLKIAEDKKDSYLKFMLKSQSELRLYLSNIQGLVSDLDLAIEKLSEN